MKNAVRPATTLILGLIAVALATPLVRAQSETSPWISRDRIARSFDVDTPQAMAALEATIETFFDTPESRAAFIAAFEANLFPPKTGTARVRALEEIKDRIERDLGPDSPVLASITAEKETVEAAVREEEARRVDALREAPLAPTE